MQCSLAEWPAYQVFTHSITPVTDDDDDDDYDYYQQLSESFVSFLKFKMNCFSVSNQYLMHSKVESLKIFYIKSFQNFNFKLGFVT